MFTVYRHKDSSCSSVKASYCNDRGNRPGFPASTEGSSIELVLECDMSAELCYSRSAHIHRITYWSSKDGTPLRASPGRPKGAMGWNWARMAASEPKEPSDNRDPDRLVWCPASGAYRYLASFSDGSCGFLNKYSLSMPKLEVQVLPAALWDRNVIVRRT